MARAAVLGRLTWRSATVEGVHPETATARTLQLSVPGWEGHRPGQHVDVRLTAPGGYTAQRPYSIGSVPTADLVELTVEVAPGGEVSPFLAVTARPGVVLEVRGPLGGWFVWSTEQLEPVQLVAGGSGVVPLMSMLRSHRAARHPAPMRLLYSVRSPQAVLFGPELFGSELGVPGDGKDRRDDVTLVYSRTAPAGDSRRPGRIDAGDIARHVLAPGQNPLCYVCGPTPFVESVIAMLLSAGHDPRRIRAERFGAGRTESP